MSGFVCKTKPEVADNNALHGSPWSHLVDWVHQKTLTSRENALPVQQSYACERGGKDRIETAKQLIRDRL
jgi:hypothetical protein